MAKSFGQKVNDKDMFPYPAYEMHPEDGFTPAVLASNMDADPMIERPYEKVRRLAVNDFVQSPEAERFDSKFIGLQPKVKLRNY